MNQLVQQLKSGKLTVQALPWPNFGPGMILVRNHYSLISPGTESHSIRTARKSLIGKAKAHPQQVKQVMDTLRKQGPVQTYRAVMKKLEAYSPLGYSCSGEVIEVGTAVKEFSVGDKVACAGAGYANHAEIVCVPENLCVKLVPHADLKQACYNTLGAIALQGVRQADLRLGESCAVIGLGLLGQLTCLMFRASGVITYGIDIDPSSVELAARYCCDAAWIRDTPGLSTRIDALTRGLGVDAVVITAATESLDPVNFAGRLARKKGRVVVVGAVPTGFDREPDWYKKELELRMSCSYGPGRYDREYEEKGHDYPAAYVRWTEKRNMQAFQQLLLTGQVDLNYLSTHEFALQAAPSAYDMMLSRSEPFLGVILRYDTHKPLDHHSTPVKTPKPCAKIQLAFIGAGSYAQSHLLPNLPNDDPDVILRGVMSRTGATSKQVAERYGFEFCASHPEDICLHPDINTVFITTRHDSHAEYVIKALRSGKHTFVEKPLCRTAQELKDIQTVLAESNGQQLMVGFNRRFSPLAFQLRQHIPPGPLSMMYRVNAGAAAPDAWALDPEIGGGRIVGEACHFIDLMTWLCRSFPVEVHAVALQDATEVKDTVSIHVAFENGSIGTVCYYANGANTLAKEYLEVYSSGITGVLNDFKELHIYGGKKTYHKKQLTQNKGQARMIRSFLDSLKEGAAVAISPSEILTVTKTCFAVLASLRMHQSIRIDALYESSVEEIRGD